MQVGREADPETEQDVVNQEQAVEGIDIAERSVTEEDDDQTDAVERQRSALAFSVHHLADARRRDAMRIALIN